MHGRSKLQARARPDARACHPGESPTTVRAARAARNPCQSPSNGAFAFHLGPSREVVGPFQVRIVAPNQIGHDRDGERPTRLLALTDKLGIEQVPDADPLDEARDARLDDQAIIVVACVSVIAVPMAASRARRASSSHAALLSRLTIAVNRSLNATSRASASACVGVAVVLGQQQFRRQLSVVTVSF
jgi:hypothetical protein